MAKRIQPSALSPTNDWSDRTVARLTENSVTGPVMRPYSEMFGFSLTGYSTNFESATSRMLFLP